MKNKFFKFNNFTFLIILIIGISIPSIIFAAFIKVNTEDSISAGDTSIINIYLDTEGKNINSVDGVISLNDKSSSKFEIKDISLANSVFSMWPRKPILENNRISFIGGVPGGVSGENLLLFKIILKVNEPGEFIISPNNVVAYLNDGLGTSLNITPKDSVVSILSPTEDSQDKWQEIVSNDHTPPMSFEIILIQDENLYDGKKFISFEAIDNESGISHYEVKEGIYPIVRAEMNYVLIDQKRKPDITVIAYDKAGNIQVSILKHKVNNYFIVFIVIIILFMHQLIKRFRKSKNKINV
ncbi:MAG: hypothetical protein QG583_266 [Patescibacteria group bacterium]|nr:hypothetical protein [Patescibacteria group bacterium]